MKDWPAANRERSRRGTGRGRIGERDLGRCLSSFATVGRGAKLAEGDDRESWMKKGWVRFGSVRSGESNSFTDSSLVQLFKPIIWKIQ